MHTKASGEFVHPAAREDYDKLTAEQASLTQGAGSSSSVNEIGLQAMSKVLGERRGHNPGRGRKLKRVASSSLYEQVRSVIEKEYGEKLQAFMAETNMKMQQAMEQAMNAMRTPNAPIPDFAMFNMPQQPPNTGDDNEDVDLSVD